MKNLFNPLLTFTLCVAICLSLSSITVMASENTRDLSLEESLATDLKQLELFKGVSDTNFDLGRVSTRTEALVMLIRMLGKEADATGGSWSDPFTDVPLWADPYIGYAYENGLTNGVSKTMFGSDAAVGSNMYLSFILRSLGYSDKNEEDFKWDFPYPLAVSCGILPKEVDCDEFLRADAVLVNYAALMAPLKDSIQTLADKLVASGVFTQTQYDTYIDKKAFSDSQALDTAISEAIMNNEAEKDLGLNYYDTENHIVMEISEDQDKVIVSAFTSYCIYKCLEETNVRSSASSNLASITLSRQSDGSYKTVDYWSPTRIESDPSANMEDKFSTPVLEKTATLFENIDSMYSVCDAWAKANCSYRRPTYEEALGEITGRDYFNVIQQFTVPDCCTIVYGAVTGQPHTPSYSLYQIRLDGTTKELPLPELNGWGTFAELDKIYLSEDKTTLYYQKTFAKKAVIDPGTPLERVIHEAGTYRYTVDLATGNVVLTIDSIGSFGL